MTLSPLFYPLIPVAFVLLVAVLMKLVARAVGWGWTALGFGTLFMSPALMGYPQWAEFVWAVGQLEMPSVSWERWPTTLGMFIAIALVAFYLWCNTHAAPQDHRDRE